MPQNQDEVREYNRNHGVPDIPSQRPKGGVERERGSNDPRWNDPENNDHGKGETPKGDEPSEGNEKTSRAISLLKTVHSPKRVCLPRTMNNPS